MFSILAQNRWRGWQNFEEKNWRGVSRDSFFLEILSPSEPILRAIIENMILPDYVLCYVPRVLENFGSMLLWLWVIICKVVGNLWGWEGYIILKPRQLLYLQTWFSESQPAKFGVRAYIILTQQFFWNRIAQNHNEDHPRIEKCTDSICVLHYLRESREGRKSKGGYSGRGELK